VARSSGKRSGAINIDKQILMSENVALSDVLPLSIATADSTQTPRKFRPSERSISQNVSGFADWEGRLVKRLHSTTGSLSPRAPRSRVSVGTVLPANELVDLHDLVNWSHLRRLTRAIREPASSVKLEGVEARSV
jgi:hypothetical protein